jgi:hypothetical protein
MALSPEFAIFLPFSIETKLMPNVVSQSNWPCHQIAAAISDSLCHDLIHSSEKVRSTV